MKELQDKIENENKNTLKSQLIDILKNQSSDDENILSSFTYLSLTIIKFEKPISECILLLYIVPKCLLSEYKRGIRRYSTEIIYIIFTTYPKSRKYILGQLSSSILINDQSSLSTVQILSSIINGNESMIIEHISILKELLDNLSNLSVPVSIVILQSLQLLFQYKPDLVDHIIIILKKLLLSRNINGRLIGIEGLLLILKSYSNEVPLSQVAYTQCVVFHGYYIIIIVHFLKKIIYIKK